MFFTNNSLFPDVNDGKIDVVSFLEASKGVEKFVELLGTIFVPIKSDINGNIKKLSTIHNSNKETFVTLNDILEFELKEDSWEKKVGTDALLWLKRALEYVCVFLTCLVEDSKEGKCPENLTPFFTKAYEEKLKPYHGWIVQNIFKVVIHAAPSRTSLIQLLSEEQCTENEVIEGAELFLEGLSKNLEIINNLYLEHNLDSSARV